MQEACTQGNLDTVKLFINLKNFSSSKPVHDIPLNALRIATENGHLNIVKYIISLYNVDFQSIHKYALRSAIRKGHLHIVEYLVDIGVDFRVENDSALRSANWYGRKNIVQYLLLKGSFSEYIFIDFKTICNIYSFGKFDLVHKLLTNNCIVERNDVEKFNNIKKSVCKIMKARKWNIEMYGAIFFTDIIFQSN